MHLHFSSKWLSNSIFIHILLYFVIGLPINDVRTVVGTTLVQQLYQWQILMTYCFNATCGCVQRRLQRGHNAYALSKSVCPMPSANIMHYYYFNMKIVHIGTTT